MYVFEEKVKRMVGSNRRVFIPKEFEARTNTQDVWLFRRGMMRVPSYVTQMGKNREVYIPNSVGVADIGEMLELEVRAVGMHEGKVVYAACLTVI